MKKLEFIKGSSHCSEDSEQSSSSEASCLSSVSTSATKEEEKESHENGFVEEDEINQATVEKESRSKLIDLSSGEESVVASSSSHEGQSQLVLIFSERSKYILRVQNFKPRSSCYVVFHFIITYKWVVISYP